VFIRYQKNYPCRVDLLFILFWIIGLAIVIRSLVFALGVPFVNWIRSEQDLNPKSNKKKLVYYRRYFDLVIMPIVFIALGVKYLWDLGSR
jgi:hypothetical protein